MSIDLVVDQTGNVKYLTNINKSFEILHLQRVQTPIDLYLSSTDHSLVPSDVKVPYMKNGAAKILKLLFEKTTFEMIVRDNTG